MTTTPCATCLYCRALSRACTHPSATSETVDYYTGLSRPAYLTIDEARASLGPCTPAALLWAALPSASSMPPGYS